MAERDAADEDDGFEPLAQDGDEGQGEEDEPPRSAVFIFVFVLAVDVLVLGSLERALELDSPFCACAVELEHREPHGEDDERGDEREDPFPELFGLRPEVGGFGEEYRYEGLSIRQNTY